MQLMTGPFSKGRSPTQPFGANFRRLLGAHIVSNLGDGVGLVAYPWLASALTRNPILISGVLVAQRLPWLVFALPVGVLVDRRNRRNLMVWADATRAALTLIVTIALLRLQTDLPTPDMVDSMVADMAIPGRHLLFAALLLATFLLGIGEVVHDTSAATILPQLVDRQVLPAANGRLASAEQAANLFIGPPLGALLLSGAFALPFLVDASTFAISAIVLLTVAASSGHTAQSTGGTVDRTQTRFLAELAEGYRALRNNTYVTLFAVVSTIINLTAGMIFAIMVFFAQDVLGAGPAQFSLLTIGSAIGSVAGGLFAVKLSERLGVGTVLRTAAFSMSLSLLALGLVGSPLPAAALLAIYGLCLVVWVVHTTSFRQAVTPNEVLGRVNGVYRFFTFGAIPIGAILAGLIVAFVETSQTRDAALRTPFLLAGSLQLLTTLAIAPRLGNRAVEDASGE